MGGVPFFDPHGMEFFLYRFVFAEIRHPEELSLCKPVEDHHLRFNYGDLKRRMMHEEGKQRNR